MFGGGVALRVDAGVVQYALTLRHPQKSGALLKGLGAQFGHLQNLLAGGKGAVLLPVFHNILGSGVVEPRHLGQKGRGGGVHIHPHRVHAVLHHPFQRLIQAGLGHVVLVLAHTDGLGVNFHQLGQRVLETAGDGHRRAQIHIVIGELLRGQLGGGIHTGPRLTDYHVADTPGRELLEELGGHLLGLPAGGAVANGNPGHTVGLNEGFQSVHGLPLLLFAEGGVDHRRIQHLAGAVHHRHLAAIAVSGVQAHGDKALHWRLHQERFQIEAKHFDGPLIRLLGEEIAGLPLHAGGNEPLIGVIRGGTDKGHRRPAGHHHLADRHLGPLAVQLHRRFQKALPLAPVDGQHLVPQGPVHRGTEVVVEAVDAVGGVLLGLAGDQHPLGPKEGAQALAHPGIVRDGLREDVAGPLEGLFHSGHPFFRVDVVQCGLFRRGAVRPNGEQQLGQRLQPFFPGHGGPSAALGLVGEVQVLHLRQRGGGVNGGGQFLCQLALIFNGVLDLLAALVQIAQVLQPVSQGAQGGVVHGPVELLAVAGDKGDGVALVHELHHIGHMGLALPQLLGQNGNHLVHGILLCVAVAPIVPQTAPVRPEGRTVGWRRRRKNANFKGTISQIFRLNLQSEGNCPKRRNCV